MRIEKSECNYQVTECDLKFGEEITLDGELLIPISVLDDIKSEIKFITDTNGVKHIHRDDVFKIIDRHMEGVSE